MAVTVNGVSLTVGKTGTYYCTDGYSYDAKVVELIDSDQTNLLVPANTGLELMPDAYCRIRFKDTIVTNPLVVATGARVAQVNCFEPSL